MPIVPFDPGSLSMLRFFYRDPREYLSHVMKVTNMSCLTPEGALSGDCDFLSANMYARSLFGTYRLATVVMLVSQQDVRRGCVGQLEYRENRTWKYHRSCADTKQNAGHCFIFGRPHHNISKGRKASCLMGCVDTRVLHYRPNVHIIHHPLVLRASCGVVFQPRIRSRRAVASTTIERSVPHRDRVLPESAVTEAQNNKPLLLTNTQQVTLRVTPEQEPLFAR